MGLVRRFHRRDRQPIAALQDQQAVQGGVVTQFRQAQQPRLANGLDVDEQPARRFDLAGGVELGG